MSHLMTVTIERRMDKLLEGMTDVTVSCATVVTSVKTLHKKTEDHEVRIRDFEKWRNNLVPVLAVGTFILGAVSITLINYWFQGI